MIKLKEVLEDWLAELGLRWKKLPLRKQRAYTLVFLLGYTVLTIAVMLKVCYDVSKSEDTVVIEHIENPTLRKTGPVYAKQDSMEMIFKNKIYERKSK